MEAFGHTPKVTKPQIVTIFYSLNTVRLRHYTLLCALSIETVLLRRWDDMWSVVQSHCRPTAVSWKNSNGVQFPISALTLCMKTSRGRTSGCSHLLLGPCLSSRWSYTGRGAAVSDSLVLSKLWCVLTEQTIDKSCSHGVGCLAWRLCVRLTQFPWALVAGNCKLVE